MGIFIAKVVTRRILKSLKRIYFVFERHSKERRVDQYYPERVKMISEESTIFRTLYSPVSIVLKVVHFYEEYFVKNLSIRPLPNANVFLFSEEIERSNLFTNLQSSSTNLSIDIYITLLLLFFYCYKIS